MPVKCSVLKLFLSMSVIPSSVTPLVSFAFSSPPLFFPLSNSVSILLSKSITFCSTPLLLSFCFSPFLCSSFCCLSFSLSPTVFLYLYVHLYHNLSLSFSLSTFYTFFSKLLHDILLKAIISALDLLWKSCVNKNSHIR